MKFCVRQVLAACLIFISSIAAAQEADANLSTKKSDGGMDQHYKNMCLSLFVWNVVGRSRVVDMYLS